MRAASFCGRQQFSTASPGKEKPILWLSWQLTSQSLERGLPRKLSCHEYHSKRTNHHRSCPIAFKEGLPRCNLSVSRAAPVPSDYDIFDYEDGPLFGKEEEEEEDDDEDIESSNEESQAINSDFHSLESSETDPEFFDTSWSFVGNEDPGYDPSKREVKLMMENERKDEVSLAPPRLDILRSFGAIILASS